MKFYMVYWNDGPHTSGYVLVALDDSYAQVTAEDLRNDAIELAMRKAVAIHDNAKFHKLEELASNRTGVLWTEEWFG